ncbi:hypothetical protein FSC37_22275 [Piscinibacter aquaticus]|uniref:Uncharacterized protein n=1 Tax=Piscinibacter aquaticus TaxID=392597 RepID=A0A5C6TNR0_9BURK|nr:hypothetical protein FSC37_22275 [Piscinibacter aquaticus]
MRKMISRTMLRPTVWWCKVSSSAHWLTVSVLIAASAISIATEAYALHVKLESIKRDSGQRAEQRARDKIKNKMRIAAQAEQALRESAPTDLRKSSWAVRSLSLQQVKVSRLDAEALLMQARRDNRYIFAPDAFEIATVNYTGSLFGASKEGADDITITLVGTATFRIGDGQ